MKYAVVALALAVFVGCGAQEADNNVPPSEPGCSAGLVANKYGNCVSDVPYQCGWERNDPGALKSTGSDIGDVIENVKMTDQCGDTVSIWDFYGDYHVLYMTAAWWQGCIIEAGRLEQAQQDFIDETGLAFSFLFALYEGASGLPATAQDVANFANLTVGITKFPVFADGSRNYANATPMTQQRHPEMCAVTPELEIISCYSGHGGYENALADIKAHAGL